MEAREHANEAQPATGGAGFDVTTSRFLNVKAMLSSLSDQTLLAQPQLSALLVEYSCWEVELADWHARQPARHDEKFKSWIGEGRAIFGRLDELKRVAAQIRHRLVFPARSLDENPGAPTWSAEPPRP